MLLELNIKNYAIISNLSFQPEEGLNVITGETGAGKSIVFDALNVSLGARGSRDVLKNEEESAYLESVFSVSERERTLSRELLDMELKDDSLIFSKEISPKGRGFSKINDRNYTQSLIQKYSENIIHIYGQHEQLDLLDEKMHIHLLDSMGDEEFEKILEEYKKGYRELLKLRRTLSDFNLNEEELQRELDFLKFQIEEIDEGSLILGEDEKLEAEEKKLANSKLLEDLCSQSEGILGGDMGEGGVLTMLNSLSNITLKISQMDEDTKEWDNRAKGLYYEAEDFKREISHYLSTLSSDEERLFEVRERIDTINKLKMKYGNSIEEIEKYREEADTKYNRLNNYNAEREKIVSEIEAKKNSLIKIAKELSSLRKKYNDLLSEKLEKELKELNMPDAKFDAQINEIDLGEEGIDEVRFMISTNKNQPLRPLSKIVSGGEMSRIMLALRTIIAEKEPPLTLVFDEIDSGISGRAVIAVGEKLKSLSEKNQVIVISHLPQIAAMADAHFLIEKFSDKEDVSSSIRKLNDEERVVEIAHLLSGKSDTALKHAKEMIATYQGGNYEFGRDDN